MKKAMIIMLLFVTSFYLSNFLHAQEERSRIGFGVSIGKEILAGDGMQLTLFDFPCLYLPINLSSNFRFEPEIGYYRYTESDENSSDSYNILKVGCGIFLLTRKGKVDIYYGARLGLVSTSSSHECPWCGREEDSKTDFYVGPAIGGEYFFH